MFERLQSVMRNKDRVERERKKRRKAEVQEMQSDSLFRARLTADLKTVSLLLMDKDIASVVVTAEDASLDRLDAAMYDSEMAEYEVVKDGRSYEIRNKMVDF